MKKYFLFPLLVIGTCISAIAQKGKIIKVACIGNSITYGSTIDDRVKDAYPFVLNRLLGAKYEVRNYGVSGATILKKANKPYVNTRAFKAALNYKPDIVVIKLGTNDSKAVNWKYRKELEANIHDFLTAFEKLDSKPKIYVCSPVPAFTSATTKGINSGIIKNEIVPLMRSIAKNRKLEFIDLYTPFLNKEELFPDKVHPKAKGAGLIAANIYTAITKQKAGNTAVKYPGVKSEWKGFDQYEFYFQPNYGRRNRGAKNNKNDFVGIPATIKAPKKALNGKPWVWRARFPNWHTEMDSILLSEGYHIAYINTNKLFGSPKAMTTWDKFYDYLTNHYGFDKKVSIEAVSRGGLFAYNWSKENPEKVNCIYAEAPVCDFKSWPGGFGIGDGSKEAWKNVLKAYDFKNDKEAKAYVNTPMHNLEALAKAKIPVLHMLGLNDKVVPITENSLKLIDIYVKLGGIATIIPCTEGKQSARGHHFPIETPRIGADFIKKNTKLLPEKLESAQFHKLRGGLRNSFMKFQREKKGRVAFLGGSITYNHGWRDMVMNYLKEKFPETKFEFIAAGIPSTGTTPAAFRVYDDVLSKGTVDLLFEEAAVNDNSNGRTSLEQIRGMEGVVRRARNNNPTMDIVLMHFVDPSKMETYRAGKTQDVIKNHEKVAAHYKLPSINLALEVTKRIDAGEFTWEKDFKNLHPSPFGQKIYFNSMKTLLENAWYGFVAEDDKITSHLLPRKLDEAAYDNGRYLSINTVKLKKGWSIDPNWKPNKGERTRPGYVNILMLVSETPGATIKMKFEGNAIGINIASGLDAGTISYSIDGDDYKELDLFTRWSQHLHLPWHYTLGAGLEYGKHTLKIKILNKKNIDSKGYACRIKSFYVNQ